MSSIIKISYWYGFRISSDITIVETTRLYEFINGLTPTNMEPGLAISCKMVVLLIQKDLPLHSIIALNKDSFARKRHRTIRYVSRLYLFWHKWLISPTSTDGISSALQEIPVLGEVIINV